MPQRDMEQFEPYFDDRINSMSIYVLPGNHYVQSSGNNAICTLLGSCVAACISDRNSAIGGLNHFLLPGQGNGGENSERYGVHAMEGLVNGILKLGAEKSNLEAKIFGGARVIETSKDDTVGDMNARFVTEYLTTENIPIMASDLGSNRARRVYFFPATGKVSVLNSSPRETGEMRRRDAEFMAQAKARVQQQKAGGVELF